MKSIFLIIAAAVCSSLAQATVQNYSLWPRRPAELEQARRLVSEQKTAEAAELLTPFLAERGIAGREARQIVGSLNVRRYLSRQNPAATVYTVSRGDTLSKVAAGVKCPAELIMLLNGMVEPSALKMEQKLVVVPARLRVEIDMAQQELSVWDGDKLVADYAVLRLPNAKSREEQQTELTAREGYISGSRLAPRSTSFAASDRLLLLKNGMRIAGEKTEEYGDALLLKQKDVNELALLLYNGTPVLVRPAASR